MTQRYHLFVIDPDSRRIAAYRTSYGWLLPMCVADTRARHLEVISAYLQQLRIDGRIVSLAGGHVDTLDGTIDWLAVVTVSSERAPETPDLSWSTGPHLESSRAVLPIQVALSKGVDRTFDPDGGETPFSRLDWWGAVESWCDNILSSTARRRTGPHILFRASPRHVVIAFETTTSPVYFKARVDSPLREPLLTLHMRHHYRWYFAPVLALDGHTGWWLAEHVGERHASRPILAAELDAILRALRVIQKDAAETPLPATLNLTDASVTALRAHVSWLVSGEEESDVPRARKKESVTDTIPSEVFRALDRIDAMATPSAWLHCDLTTGNLRFGQDGVCFIDLDRSARGPALLTIPVLVDALTAEGALEPEQQREAHRQFAESISGIDRRYGLEDTLQAAYIAACLVRSLADVTHIRRRITLGEVVCPVSFVKTRARARLLERLRHLSS